MSLNQLLTQGKKGGGLDIDCKDVKCMSIEADNINIPIGGDITAHNINVTNELKVKCDDNTEMILKTPNYGLLDQIISSNGDGTLQFKTVSGGGGSVTNPLTSNLVGDAFEIQNISKLTINQTTPFDDVLDITGKFKQSATNTVFYNMNSTKTGGVQGGADIGITNYNTFDNTDTIGLVARASCRALGAHTTTNRGCDYIINSTLSNQITIGERLKISGDGKTYITGGLDITDDLNMNNNNIVDIGLANYNLETSLLDLTTRTQNINASASDTVISGRTDVTLGNLQGFNIFDDNFPTATLYFSIAGSGILSQILHTFSSGLEPISNLTGSIGTALKKFNTLWIDKINGITPVGGLYAGLSDGVLVQGGFLTSLLPVTGTPVNGLSIPANGFTVGDSFHLVCSGDIPTGNSGDVVTITLNQNGSQLAQLTLDMENSTNTFFELEADFVCRAIGVTGEFITSFDFTFNKTLLKDFKGSRHVQLSTINTTTASTLTLTAQFSGVFLSTMRTRLFYLRKQF